MAYPRRSAFPPGTYHVGDRATGGGLLFLDLPDRTRLLSLFDAVVERERWDCYAYCLMSTHWHFVLHTSDELSRGMQWLKSMYARAYNERHGRSGTLFERRFWCQPIESEEELAQVVQYVVYNPVRAGLCSAPCEWRFTGGKMVDLVR